MLKKETLPSVYYEKPENDPTSHVYYQVHKGWGNRQDISMSQAMNSYIFENPWNNAIKTQPPDNQESLTQPYNRPINVPLPEDKMYSGYNVGKFV